MNPEFLSRLQFAPTASFHFIFPVVVGLTAIAMLALHGGLYLAVKTAGPACDRVRDLSPKLAGAYNMTATNAASQQLTLEVMLVVALISLPFVVLYTSGIQYLFRGKVELTPDSY